VANKDRFVDFREEVEKLVEEADKVRKIEIDKLARFTLANISNLF
jgi:hypothetical protein